MLLLQFRKTGFVIWAFVTYCIYLRISREILDKNWAKYFQFDLYTDQTFASQKWILIELLNMLMTIDTKPLVKNEILVASIYGSHIHQISQIKSKNYPIIQFSIFIIICGQKIHLNSM